MRLAPDGGALLVAGPSSWSDPERRDQRLPQVRKEIAYQAVQVVQFDMVIQVSVRVRTRKPGRPGNAVRNQSVRN